MQPEFKLSRNRDDSEPAMDRTYYNISPDDGRNMMFTGKEIYEAARRWDYPLLLDVGEKHPYIWCWLAATVHGWCTVVLSKSKGGIIQEWAGCFTTGPRQHLEKLCAERLRKVGNI